MATYVITVNGKTHRISASTLSSARREFFLQHNYWPNEEDMKIEDMTD